MLTQDSKVKLFKKNIVGVKQVQIRALWDPLCPSALRPSLNGHICFSHLLILSHSQLNPWIKWGMIFFFHTLGSRRIGTVWTLHNEIWGRYGLLLEFVTMTQINQQGQQSYFFKDFYVHFLSQGLPDTRSDPGAVFLIPADTRVQHSYTSWAGILWHHVWGQYVSRLNSQPDLIELSQFHCNSSVTHFNNLWKIDI